MSSRQSNKIAIAPCDDSENFALGMVSPKIDALIPSDGEDRRSSVRHRTVMRAARLSSCVHNVQGMGIVRNISEGGMLVEGPLCFEIGEHVAISLVDGDRIAGEIIWNSGKAFGIQFSEWISVETTLTKSQEREGSQRSRPPRLKLDRPILLRHGSIIADAHLCDISQRGAKIRIGTDLPIDCRVQITQEGIRPVSGSIKWQADTLAGIEFHRTLDIDEIATWTNDRAE